ncbi:hypothetical protein [Variovorax sp. 278MFTsu5.1]|uniref:hypothetical protein n=1 Tax=Variovorax sp. 278MFTsu5.1 TaxID=3158366 RepID=UPI003AACB857
MIANITPGLTSTSDLDLNGQIVALSASKGRFANPLLQLHQVTGGSGCSPTALGSGVFVRPLWVESPEGSGNLARNTASGTPHEDDGSFKTRRGAVLGVVSPELLALVEANTEPKIAPVDPSNLCVIAASNGCWGKGDTVKEALRKAGAKLGDGTFVAVIHREAYLSDWGSIMTPTYCEVAGRPNVQMVYNSEELRPRLPKAEEMAAQFIAAAKVQA